MTRTSPADKYGAAANRVSMCPYRERANFIPAAAPAPTITSVIASPVLKVATRPMPRQNAPVFSHASRTVMTAGQGIRPPVKPKMTV